MKSNTRNFRVRLMTILLSAVLVAASLSLLPEAYAADGPFRGTGVGHGGSIVLDVTVQNSRIEKIEVVSQEETPEYWSRARDLLDKIIKYQRWDDQIDAITGATESSDGIKNAVADALKDVEIDRTGVPEPGDDHHVIIIKDTDAQPEIINNPATDPAYIFDSGKGTKTDPYIIRTSDQLRLFALSVKDDRYDHWEDNTANTYKDKYIALAGDIDVSDGIWIPVGQGVSSFDGYFDGRNHKITGIYAGTEERPMRLLEDVYYYGFFGSLEMHARVSNLTLEDVDLHISGARNITLGGLTGITQREYSETDKDGAVIDNCRVTGNVELLADTHNNMTGGLIGQQVRGATINSSSDANVSCYVADTTMYAQAGGLIGGQALALVANCAATGNVYASIPSGDGGYAHAGSLVAIMDGDIVNCYGSGSVASEYSTERIGALFGTLDEAGKAYNCCYDPSIEVACAGAAIEAAAGYIYDKNDKEAISDDGRRYIGGVAYNLSAAGESAETADLLNSNYNSFPVDLSIYGLGSGSLSKWQYANSSMMPTGERVDTNYELCEADVVELDLHDGVYYGRSADKSTVVRITVKDGHVEDRKVVKGETSGDVYYDALDTAREKSSRDDISTYDKLNPARFGGGKGTKSEPYLISSELQLRSIAQSLNEDTSLKGIYFLQTSDIKVSSDDWLPIGWGVRDNSKASDDIQGQYTFAGNYDGNGYTISGITISNDEASEAAHGYYACGAGMFGVVSGAELKNIDLKDVTIDLRTGQKHTATAAALAAQTGTKTKIDGCSASGTVTVKSESAEAKGAGIVGYGSNTLMTNCISDVEVRASGGTVIGGGLYSTDSDCVTMNCISRGDVTGEGNSRIGGFSGTAAGLMFNCVYEGTAKGKPAAGAFHGIRMNKSAIDYLCRYDSEKNAEMIGMDYGKSQIPASILDTNIAFTTDQVNTEEFINALNRDASSAAESIKTIDDAGLGTSYIGRIFDPDTAPGGKWSYDNCLAVSTDAPKYKAPEKSDGEKDGKQQSASEVKNGTKFTASGCGYRVISAKDRKVSLRTAKNRKSVTVPNTVKYKGVTYKVVQTEKGAFKGKAIRTVTIGKNVTRLKSGTWAGSKATKIILKTKSLKKPAVKGSLKGSRIKTIKVKVGRKKDNRKYIKKYKKIFTKGNAGRKVKIS